jgi:hypothetical protein
VWVKSVRKVDAQDICPCDHDGSEVIVITEVFLAIFGNFLRRKAFRGGVLQFLIIDIFELIVERAVVGGVDLCNCFVEDEV